MFSSRTALSVIFEFLLDFGFEALDVLLHSTSETVFVGTDEVIFPLSQLNEVIPDFLEFVDSLIIFWLNRVFVHSEHSELFE